MNKLKSLAFVALAAFGLSALGAVQDTTWWDVDFESPTSNGVSFVQGELGNLTNSVEYAYAGDQPYASGVWYALDGDESYVTNGIVTNVVGAVATETNSDYLKLDTQGNDLRWEPKFTDSVSNKITLVDADLLLVGSDSAPDAGDFDQNLDVQTAIFLKNEIDDGTGDTTNSVLCVYVYDNNTGGSYWQELEGQEILKDNSWHHVRVIVDYTMVADGDYASVQVFVDDMNTPMHAAGDTSTTSWTAANRDKKFKNISSVSFRGTGAVDNFLGTIQEEIPDFFDFTAEVYMDGTFVPSTAAATNKTTVMVDQEVKSNSSVKFEGFKFDDWTSEVVPATWCLEKVEVVDVVSSNVTTYTYTYSGSGTTRITADEPTDNPVEFAVVRRGAIWVQTGAFSVKVPTAGATGDMTVAKIYFKTIGAYNAIATTTADGVCSTNAVFVKPADIPLTTNWTFNAVQGGNILSNIVVSGGATLAYDAGVATVSISLNEALAADTVFAAATYAPGSLAEGQELRYTEAGGVYTFTPYTPPVAIIVAGNVTNEYPSLRAAIDVALPGSTIYLVADDKVSFTAEDPEVVINKALTIDGGSNTLYGVTDHDSRTAGDHDLFINSKAGNVTLKNLTFSEFSDSVPAILNRTYPIWTSEGYAGMLTLDGVTIEKYARTAVNLNNGSFLITNCVIRGRADDATKPAEWYQAGITTKFGQGDVYDTVITGIGAEAGVYDSACFTLGVEGTGRITVHSGDYTGDFVASINSNATGRIELQGGTFVATNVDGEEDEDPPSAFITSATVDTIVISGGWFDREPAAKFLAAGYVADEAAPGTDTPWTVVLGNAIWIGGASGDWNVPANWDVGCVPTTTTVVTFTNDATVGISPTVCKCKEMVLANANVTIGRADPGTGADLNFYKNAGDAVSGTGTLTLNTVGLFNQNKSGVLTIGTDLDIQGDVTFKGVKDDHGGAGSWTVTGETTIADGVTVKTIDDAITTFQGDIEIDAGSPVTFFAAYGAPGSNHGGEIVVDSTSTVTLASPAAKLLLQTRNDGKITINDSQVVTDSADYYVKKSSQQNVSTENNGTVNQTTYEVLSKPTVFVTRNDANVTDVTGVTNAMLVTPGVDLTIGVTVAEGYEPSVTIKKASDNSVLLTTNAASFVYAMPEYGINVTPTAVLKTFDITFKPENGGDDIVTNVAYGATAYIPADPTLAGFTFLGWTNALDATDTTLYDNANLPAATADATYAAKWEETPSGHIGAKSDEGFVILAPADGDYDDTKPLTFAAPNITAGTVAISASMVGPDSGTTAQLTLLYKTDLTAANYSKVEVTVKDIDATAGTATVELPANFMDGKNTLFFFGFSNEPGVLDDPQP